MDREKITFAQAEGAVPLPSSLRPKEITQGLRAKLWFAVRELMKEDQHDPAYGGLSTIGGNWRVILRDWFVFGLNRMVDEFADKYQTQEKAVKDVIQNGDYIQIFEFLQFALRHRAAPAELAEYTNIALKAERAAYRVVNKTIAPISSEEEAKAVTTAFAALKANEFAGARKHLTKAAEFLTSGKDADSIRESIHAVEAVARLVDPDASAGLGPALKALEKGGYINPVLKNGLEKIYGYTNAEQGIRHPMLDEATAKVDEIDAQFMFGACASFISYLIAKARKAKIEIK